MPEPFLHPQDELDEVNRHPLNQEAKRWLLVANAEIDSTLGPYLFQLMSWVLDSGKVVPRPDLRSQLRSAVDELLFLLDPEKAMRHFVPHPDDPDGEPLEVEDLSKYRVPEDVASFLVDRLHWRLVSDENLGNVYPPPYPHNSS